MRFWLLKFSKNPKEINSLFSYLPCCMWAINTSVYTTACDVHLKNLYFNHLLLKWLCSRQSKLRIMEKELKMLWVKITVSQSIRNKTKQNKTVVRTFDIPHAMGNKKAGDMGLKIFLEIKEQKWDSVSIFYLNGSCKLTR